MIIQNQDEEYEEEEFEEDEGLEDESGESTDAGITTIFGIPKKIFIVAAIIIVLIILVLALLSIKKLKSGGSSDTSTDMPAEISTDQAGGNFYDLSGNIAGSVIGVYEGAEVYDQNIAIVGYISSTGEMIAYDASGSVWFYYTTGAPSTNTDVINTNADSSSTDTGEYVDDGTGEYVDDGTGEPVDVTTEEPVVDEAIDGDEWVFDLNKNVQDFSLYEQLQSSEPNMLLKSYGYTGDEIKLAEELGLSTEQLVLTAQSLMDATTAQSLERMSDHASKEFQTMYKYSEFSMPHVKFSPIPKLAESWVMNEGYYIVNADYEKCPIYGYQLKLKIKIANGTYVFMNVTPQHWQELADEGNMVVSVTYSLYGRSKKTAHLYITKVEEIDTTNNTVNPKDSGSSLDELVNTGNDNVVPEETEETEEDEDDGNVIWS